MTSATKGFTLIEVMVALAIVAIALATGARAYSQWIEGSRLLHERMLATICLQNQWAKISLAPNLPPVGEDYVSCLQDGQSFQVQVHVSATPNARFRKIDMSVFSPTEPGLTLGTMITAVAK